MGQEADPVLVGAGDIASCKSTGDEATADLLGIEGTVATFGDNAYEQGTSRVLRMLRALLGPVQGAHQAQRGQPRVLYGRRFRLLRVLR